MDQGTCPPAAEALTKDSWGWELQNGAAGEGTVVKGLFRFKQGSELEQALISSGLISSGVRAYWDPVNWEQTPIKKKPFISWVEQLSNESYADYAVRALSLTGGLGLARGWRQLGIRSSQGVPVPEFISRNWTLKGCPRHWDQEDLVQFLEGADFKDMVFYAKKRERFGTCWQSRGSHKVPQTYMQLLYEGSDFETGKFLVVEKTQRNGLSQGSTRLQGERRISLGPGNPKKAEVTQVEEQLGETQLDPSQEEGNSQPNQEDLDQQEDASMSTVNKRAAGFGGSPEKKRSCVHPLPKGVARIANEGSGNCLFLSVSDALKAAGGGNHNHLKVRATAINHLKKHHDKYYGYWDHLLPDGSQSPDVTIDGFRKYIDLVAVTWAWAGNLELAALAATLDRPISVIHEQGQIYSFNLEGRYGDLFVYYSPTIGHYEALQVPRDMIISLRTKALAGRTKGGRRAGGKSASVSSVLGGCTAASEDLGSLGGLTVNNSKASKKAKGSVHSGKAHSLGGLTRKTHLKKQSQSCASSFREKTHDAGNFGSPSKRASGFGSSKRTEWNKRHIDKGLSSANSIAPTLLLIKWEGCVKLNIRGRALFVNWFWLLMALTLCLANVNTLPGKRNAHLAKRHPDEYRKGKAAHMREYVEVVLARADLPTEQRDWSCAFCNCGLPTLNRTAKQKSITYHYRAKHRRRDTSIQAIHAARAKKQLSRVK